MTELNNAPRAQPTTRASVNPPAPAPPSHDEPDRAQPPADEPVQAPLSPRAQVNTAILAFGAALGAANAFALSLDGIPLNILPLTIAQLCASLEDLTVAGVEVSSAISVALAPTDPDANPAVPNDKDFLSFSAPWIAGNLYGVVPLAPLTAIPDRDEKWFAITRGRYVGLTTNSAISINAVTGVPSGLSDRCASQAEALQHFNVALAAHAVAFNILSRVPDLSTRIGKSELQCPNVQYLNVQMSSLDAPKLPSSTRQSSDLTSYAFLSHALPFQPIPLPSLPFPPTHHTSPPMSGPPPPYIDPVDELLADLTRLRVASTDTSSPTHPNASARFSRSPPPLRLASSSATTVSVPSSPLRAPSTPSRPNRVYAYSSPTQSGITAAWSEAAAATQGVSGGGAHRVVKLNKKPRRKNAASDAECQVKGARPALHQGYPTQAAAVAAFEYAVARGWTRVSGSLSVSSQVTFRVEQAPLGSLPTPTSLTGEPSPLAIGGDIDGSCLEVGLNTIGLSCATYQSFPTKSRAILEFQEALEKGFVKLPGDFLAATLSRYLSGRKFRLGVTRHFFDGRHSPRFG
ncbi:hypothetical protein C8F04DRAFT_1176789 [Mycena alexandri]|uniref:Uncharacterized protein n=1 Tax=Mycena alexandri TaxID=1745969 RepID=A0AAD6X9K6_9AGAR|nr:hypothetical protein C8F04DRAFT_1176789 [Mycena alexandri]